MVSHRIGENSDLNFRNPVMGKASDPCPMRRVSSSLFFYTFQMNIREIGRSCFLYSVCLVTVVLLARLGNLLGRKSNPCSCTWNQGAGNLCQNCGESKL